MSAVGRLTTAVECDADARVRPIVEEVLHLLPAQAPLHAFVHHNTLHAFESLPFEEAVVSAAQLFGAEPFLTEAEFSQELTSGRIRSEDIDAVLDERATAADDVPMFAGGPTRRDFRKARLRCLTPLPTGAALRWLLRETDAMRKLAPHLGGTRRRELMAAACETQDPGSVPTAATAEAQLLTRLWTDLERVSQAPPRAVVSKERPRVSLLQAYGVDTDDVVHGVLIRTCAAFLDQGVAYWRMPGRERGYLATFRKLYGLPIPPVDRDLRGLAALLRKQQAQNWSAEHTAAWALNAMAVPAAAWHSVIRDTLLSLRGWAGMMHQLEQRPESAPVVPVAASLMDYLAVQLSLDVVAATNVLRSELGRQPGHDDFVRLRASAADNPQPAFDELSRVYEAFILAQSLPVAITELNNPENARIWRDEVTAFDQTSRRYLLHLAYERRHRIQVLDALIANARAQVPQTSAAPRFQAVFCMDDREESLRRHLEEIAPRVETFGYAGFFGVVMKYQGLDDVRPRALCPIVLEPQHLVEEKAVNPVQAETYRRRLRRHGAFSYSYSVGSKTLLRGGGFTALLGMFMLVPLALRSAWPRLAEAWAHCARTLGRERPTTRLQLECRGGARCDGMQVGYTVDEMVSIVSSMLSAMNLRANSPLVIVVGHGSSSLNNPHEAAYNCGATGGGRGGPNARAFAAMANHCEVRRRLADSGQAIAEGTWFVAAYHNTCDDSMTYYDLDLLPKKLEREMKWVRTAMQRACEFDAHERARRFELAPTELSPERAIDVAKAHANDLGEPRPEYGHSTNAVCVIGRRSRTRGLFFDRRSFLVSYDPDCDPEGETLSRLLNSVGPVGAGINLEYYFSRVDPVGYGCGTKLPHNITGLIGVMDGHASDLRTGLTWQMVEIHEPVRLLTVVEATPAKLNDVIAQSPALARLVGNGWIQLVAWEPDSGEMRVFREGSFHDYHPESADLPVVASSAAHYRRTRGALAPARVHPAVGGSQ